MTRFFNGLNQDIHDEVKLQYHSSLEDIFQQATKVENQIKGRKSFEKICCYRG